MHIYKNSIVSFSTFIKMYILFDDFRVSNSLVLDKNA